MKNDLNQLQKQLGFFFKNPQILNQALVHRSYLNESPRRDIQSNERMEFLGDSILSFVVSEWLYQEFPNYKEGQLTNLRSNLVRTSTLSQIANELKLGSYLQMSRGEKISGGEKNPTLLANTLESLVGAIFLDQGIKKAEEFIKIYFWPFLKKLISKGEFKDSKSLLQEKIQETIKESPIYKTLKEEGPAHNKTFTVGVYSQGKLLGRGIGKSKQEAEEEAAKLALNKISRNKKKF